VLFKKNFETWRQEQLHPSIAIILQGKKIGIRPSWQEIASGEVFTKIYWDFLELRNGVCTLQKVGSAELKKFRCSASRP